MAYGLPTRGQPDWDDEVNNSVEALKATIDNANATTVAALAAVNALTDSVTTALNRANEALTAANNAVAIAAQKTGPPGPPGQNLIAYAENVTNTATTFAAVTLIPGCVIWIPPSTKDVWIEWSAYLTNTGSTADSRGPIYTLLYELTGGAAVAKGSDFIHKDLGINYVTTAFGKSVGSYRAGPSTSSRIFALYAQTVKEAGTTLSGSTLNSPTGPSLIAAVER